jgi:hypothetical protein
VVEDQHTVGATFRPIPVANDELKLIASNWRRVLPFFHNTAITLIVGEIGCGPFDGGCVIVARAIQTIIGGDVMVLVAEDDQAEHAVVERNGLLWDYSGPARPTTMIRRFNRAERARIVSRRPLQDGDLTCAASSASLEADLVAVFALAFKAFLANHAHARSHQRVSLSIAS